MRMKLPAFKKNSKDDTVTWVDLHTDMMMMTIESGDLVIRTKEETFVLPSSLDEWAKVLQEYGYEKSDRNCIIKLDGIVDHDEKSRLVFFDENRGNKHLSATVSNANWNKIKKFLKLKRQSD